MEEVLLGHSSANQRIEECELRCCVLPTCLHYTLNSDGMCYVRSSPLTSVGRQAVPGVHSGMKRKKKIALEALADGREVDILQRASNIATGSNADVNEYLHESVGQVNPNQPTDSDPYAFAKEKKIKQRELEYGWGLAVQQLEQREEARKASHKVRCGEAIAQDSNCIARMNAAENEAVFAACFRCAPTSGLPGQKCYRDGARDWGRG